ncbi:serine hydrolase domain-containing protein [Actinoalloteichus hymeniacidonis]|uniref:Penicillin-binding protein, beta-lactamase class C n=1 Tax=Actinoalloteichus hymeniacidonis TaxID=340345 RepID=A0AAC9N011_9PSEU|nr:serine hydrolase domain-containing protein [Actinoalloteichus hymeniacidonis]AOS64486.1 penicillin-binding protein, beta-lactamase class C [Actinoalloteichus hymeniacidonis]MBB5907443.1 D-alanyl-D-alanine carboxypeptidase [Actinoalloteichus hymeniacidonis]
MNIRYAGTTRSTRRATATVAGTLTVLALVTACAGTADTGMPSATPSGDVAAQHSGAADTPTPELGVLLDELVDAGAPGVVALVDDGAGEPIELTGQAGWVEQRLSVQDQFRMGSNTKTMIGVLTLQQVADGTLSLSDTVEKWLPAAIPNGDEITLRMLLNHTSGLDDYVLHPEVLGLITGNSTTPLPPARLLEAAVELPALAAPGTAYAYSNANYIALGMVLERATEQQVADLLQQRILDPLALTDTYLATDGESRDGDLLAEGYEPDAEHLAPLLPPGTPEGVAFVGEPRDDHVEVSSIDPSWSWTAGAVVSTPSDWQRFLRALLSGSVLPPAQLAEMKETVVEFPGEPASARYGLGLEQYQSPCGSVWGHTGGIPGYASANYVDESGTRSVTVVTTTQFGLRTEALGAAERALIDGAVCAMSGEPLPATEE